VDGKTNEMRLFQDRFETESGHTIDLKFYSFRRSAQETLKKVDESCSVHCLRVADILVVILTDG
jgi:hypothetical protein